MRVFRDTLDLSIMALQPLAERLRPQSLDDYIGQKHLVGENGVFRKFIASGSVPSFILWGPPGVGKTTLAKIVATALDRPFYTLSAVTSGVKDVRDVIEKAKNQHLFNARPAFLFIDEIHRFNKSQQDSLLGAVEQGIVTLIGATTENPSFEVISPLLSRCQVYVLKPMTDDELQELLDRALHGDELLQRYNIEVRETEALFRFSGGDARKLLNILDIVIGASGMNVIIDDKHVTECLQQNIALYDKGGEQHYDVISAFIKSVRGSDPNAAIYYLARMLAGGEEPRFIARRLVILASEDIGLANPNALLLANACFDAVHNIGMPEARIPLAETTIYLATSPKSNSAYAAINMALKMVEHDSTNRPVPLHLRNAPTKLMGEMGYGAEYKYAHDYAGNFVRQEFMPEGLSGKRLYTPNTQNAQEAKIAERMTALWGDKYGK
jgi:putative ATPase